jgi:hypothetical protein
MYDVNPITTKMYLDDLDRKAAAWRHPICSRRRAAPVARVLHAALIRLLRRGAVSIEPPAGTATPRR